MNEESKVALLDDIDETLDFDRDGMLSVSDDAWFCQQAARIGIETWCDPTIQAGHIGECEY